MNNYAIVNNVFRHDLDNQFIKEFSDNHLLVLVYIQKFKTYLGKMDFCLGWLFDDLNVNSYQLQKDLINCINDLIKWKLIVLHSDVSGINKNTRLKVELSTYDGRFTQILFSEVDKILTLDIDIRVKKTMLYLYTDITSWIDLKGYCYTSYKYFKNDLNTTSDNRINDALILLKKNQLIDYENVGQILINGNIEQGNNVYVICCHKDHKERLSEGVANRRRDYEDKKAQIHKGTKSNNQRGLKQKLNHLWKKYNDGVILECELVELNKKEKEYYQLRKHDENINEIPFIFLNPSKSNTEDEIKKLFN